MKSENEVREMRNKILKAIEREKSTINENSLLDFSKIVRKLQLEAQVSVLNWVLEEQG